MKSDSGKLIKMWDICSNLRIYNTNYRVSLEIRINKMKSVIINKNSSGVIGTKTVIFMSCGIYHKLFLGCIYILESFHFQVNLLKEHFSFPDSYAKGVTFWMPLSTEVGLWHANKFGSSVSEREGKTSVYITLPDHHQACHYVHSESSVYCTCIQFSTSPFNTTLCLK